MNPLCRGYIYLGTSCILSLALPTGVCCLKTQLEIQPFPSLPRLASLLPGGTCCHENVHHADSLWCLRVPVPGAGDAALLGRHVGLPII